MSLATATNVLYLAAISFLLQIDVACCLNVISKRNQVPNEFIERSDEALQHYVYEICYATGGEAEACYTVGKLRA